MRVNDMYLKNELYLYCSVFIFFILISYKAHSNIEQKTDAKDNLEEEFTPKLFSEEETSEIENEVSDNETHIEKLFDQENNEEEDFEIPAFLRKQKF